MADTPTATPAPASQTVAAPPAPTPTPTPPAASPATGEWTAGFSDEMKGFIQNKGFKGPQDLADSYRNLEKLQGVPQDRLLKLPESMKTPEGRAILERLGLPKDAKGYALKTPEKGDPKFTEWAAETFHKAGLTRDMGELLLGEWEARATANQTATAENQKAAIMQADAALKKEWGMAYDQNINIAKAGVKALELDPQTIDIIESIQGREKLFKMLHKVGQGIGEAQFVSGAPAANGALAPNQAKAKIEALRSDQDFVARLMKGDSDAKQQWQRAHEMAAPGDLRLS